MKGKHLPPYLPTLQPLGLHCSQGIVWRCWNTTMCQLVCFGFFLSSTGCIFIVIVVLFAPEMAEVCTTCCGAWKGEGFLCMAHKGSRPFESSKCDSMGPFRHRQKKRRIHMDAHANLWTQCCLTKRATQTGPFLSFSFTSTCIAHTHTHSLTCNLFTRNSHWDN